MRRTGEPMMLSLPPFTRAVTWLIGINTGVFLLLILFNAIRIPAGLFIKYYCALVPLDVVQRGFLWQIVTYSFLHEGFMHWFGNMLGLGCSDLPSKTPGGLAAFLSFTSSA